MNSNHINLINKLRDISNTDVGYNTLRLLMTIAKENYKPDDEVKHEPLFMRCLHEYRPYNCTKDEVKVICKLFDINGGIAAALCNAVLTMFWKEDGLIHKSDIGYYMYQTVTGDVLCADCMMLCMDAFVGLYDIGPKLKCVVCPWG